VAVTTDAYIGEVRRNFRRKSSRAIAVVLLMVG